MSAVSMQVAPPLYTEALAYWDELALQCGRHVAGINAVVQENHLPDQDGLALRTGPRTLAMNRGVYPSTEISLRLSFEHWGPKISGSVRGYQDEDLRFYPEEFEFAVGSDGDQNTIAITGEGRSLTPHEFAKYLAQNFRRCYPGLSLPSPENPFD